jgi:hypothetical protein
MSNPSSAVSHVWATQTPNSMPWSVVLLVGLQVVLDVQQQATELHHSGQHL